MLFPFTFLSINNTSTTLSDCCNIKQSSWRPSLGSSKKNTDTKKQTKHNVTWVQRRNKMNQLCGWYQWLVGSYQGRCVTSQWWPSEASWPIHPFISLILWNLNGWDWCVNFETISELLELLWICKSLCVPTDQCHVLAPPPSAITVSHWLAGGSWNCHHTVLKTAGHWAIWLTNYCQHFINKTGLWWKCNESVPE